MYQNHNHIKMMYGSWDTEWDWQKFLSFLVIFCPFIHLMIPKIKILKKMTKMPEDIFPLHMHTINENNMMHDSWNTSWETKSFVILNHFLPFHHPDNLKIKKTPGDIIVLHMCIINDNHMINDSWDMEHHRQNSFLLFALLPL